MARIPDEEIERLKSEVSLVRLVESSGVELKKQGKDYVGCCPFHADKTPSLVVSPSKNLWHCLGACNVGGTVIDWTMKMQGVSFRHAVELLREQPSSLAADASAVVKTSTVRKLAGETPFSPDADDGRLLSRVVDFYQTRLKESPAALDYLKQRGLAHPELLDTFRIGYADRTLAYRLPQKNRAAGEAIRTRLQALGILRESGHEHFNGSLVFPLLDERGHVVQAYGRKIRDDLRAGTPMHLYLPRPQAGVFNRQALIASKEIILCEAIIDALTFWCAGFRNVTTAYGVNGFTDELLAAMKQHGTQRVLIAYDRDEAGDRAAAELATRLMAEGIDAFRIVFPHGLDVNAYALKVQPAQKSLGVAIRGAQWMGKGARSAASEPIVEHPVPPIAVSPAPVSSLAAAVVPAVRAALPEAEPIAADPLLEPSMASPLPPALSSEIPIEVREHEILILLGDRRWRVRGFSKTPTPGQLKINLLVCRGEAFHVDTLDLYSARLRTAFVKQATAELAFSEEVLKRDLGAVLLKLEAMQAEEASRVVAPPGPTISDADKAAALDLLRDPRLCERIAADLTACGVVGEDVNKLVAYLAGVSRKLDRPLAVLIQSLSAAGKSALMDAVLELVPEEDRVQYSAMTGQSLYYLGEQDLKHKILAIAEEEGVNEAAYALKLLQSQGVLTIASTGKDPVTGELRTRPYRVEGPVMLFLTTTATDLDEELQNRCLVLTVNESREQTRAIHAAQRAAETLQGLLAGQAQAAIRKCHQNAQRLLRPLKVVNPYAEQLSFLDDRTRLRRDHKKYLCLIRTIALLHQYQREVKVTEHDGATIEYIEVTPADIALANRLAHQVLGQSLDALPPQTRRLLELLHGQVQTQADAGGVPPCDVRFTRREVMERTRWSYEQVRVHLDRLVDMEYLIPHRGSRGASFVYELLYRGEGRDGARFVMGLTEVGTATTETLGGVAAGFGGPLSPACGGLGVGVLAAANADGARDGNGFSGSTPENRTSGVNGVKPRRSRIAPSLVAASAAVRG